MEMSDQQVVETFIQYKRKGLVKRAHHLIENVDNIVTCINIEEGRDPSSFKQNVSKIFKLNLYEDEIKEATTDQDISEVISTARFVLQYQDLLDEIVNIGRNRQLHPIDTVVIDDDDLPDIISPTLTPTPTCSLKSKSPVKGIRGLHKRKPYAKPSATVTNSSSTSSTLTETAWEKRENELLLAHQRELSEAKQEARDELMLCIICLSAQKDHTLVPCGHTFCEYCVDRIKVNGKCCFCNAKIRSSVKVRLTD